MFHTQAQALGLYSRGLGELTMRQVTRLGAKPPGASLRHVAFDRCAGSALSKGDHSQGWERLKQAHFNLGHLPSLSAILPGRLWGQPPPAAPNTPALQFLSCTSQTRLCTRVPGSLLKCWF